MQLFIPIFVILLILIILLGPASYIAYRKVFYAPKRLTDEDFKMPVGEQYDKRRAGISKCINTMLARPFEPVTITSHDGLTLYARYYHAADNAPLQIQFHGYKSSAVLDFSGGSTFAGNIGHNALVVDQRSHGKSEGNCITFGIRERMDCLSWVNYALNRFGTDTKIILAGLSMGAATVLMSTTLPLPENVVGIMADCPFSSPKEVIKKVGRDLHLPVTILYPIIRLGARLYGGFDLEACSPLEAVRHTNIPILLFHGEDDRFVPCDMSREIAKACASPILFETVPDAGHGLSYLVSPKRYESLTMEFIRNVLGE